jgi:hypothetical protein
MTLQDVIEQLNLTVLTQPGDFAAVTPTSGYTSDLLSCVMAGARKGAVWVTLQAHLNIVAVAALLEMSAVIITEGAQPETATISKANEEGITLLATDRQSFEVAGRLWELGLR